MNHVTRSILAFVAGALLATSTAAALDCPSLTVKNLWVYTQTGTLVATVDSPVLSQQRGWALCSLNSTVGLITPDMCSTIYTTLLVAKTTQTQVVISFANGLQNGSGGTALTCDDVPTFDIDGVAPHVWYVRLNP